MTAVLSMQLKVGSNRACWLVPLLSGGLLACAGKAAESYADGQSPPAAVVEPAALAAPPAALALPADSLPATVQGSAPATPVSAPERAAFSGSATIPAPELPALSAEAVLASGGAIITWGHTGVLYKDHPGNLRLLHNVLADLTKGAPAARTGRLLYTSNCDPRKDSRYCQVADSLSELVGFFNTVAEFGSLEFRSALAVTLTDYSAVIFDSCAGEEGTRQLDAYLEAGGRALVLGDNFCFSNGRASAQSANALLRGSGLDFTSNDPGWSDAYEVPVEQRAGLLEGVESLDIFRVAPQQIQHSFAPVVQARSGVLMARLGGALPLP
jgi:hypothetical protein